jgi:hypothetical protein
MAPSGEYAIVAVNYVTRVQTDSGAFTDCTAEHLPDFPPQQCRFGIERETSDSANLYRIELAGDPNPRVIKRLPGVEIEWLALSELEDEIVWQSVQRADFVNFRYLSQSADGTHPWYGAIGGLIIAHPPATCTGRLLEYRPFDRRANAPKPVGESKSSPQAPIDGCNAPQANLAGTISPIRGATGGAMMPSATKASLPRADRVPRSGAPSPRRFH